MSTQLRRVTPDGSVRLLSQLLFEAECEVTYLRSLFVHHYCTCWPRPIDPLDVDHHPASCGYRQVMAEELVCRAETEL